MGDSSRWKSKLRKKVSFICAKGGHETWGKLGHLLPHGLHHRRERKGLTSCFLFQSDEMGGCEQEYKYIYASALFYAFCIDAYIVQTGVQGHCLVCMSSTFCSPKVQLLGLAWLWIGKHWPLLKASYRQSELWMLFKVAGRGLAASDMYSEVEGSAMLKEPGCCSD